MGSVCSDHTEVNLRGHPAYNIVQRRNSEVMQLTLNLQVLAESEAVLQDLYDGMQKEAQVAKNQLRKWVLRVRVVPQLLKNRPKAALLYWRNYVQVLKDECGLETSEGKEVRSDSLPIQKSNRNAEVLGALVSVIKRLESRLKAALKIWTLYTSNEKNRLFFRSAHTKLLTKVIEKARGQLIKRVFHWIWQDRDRGKEVTRALSIGHCVKLKQVLKTWKDSVAGMKVNGLLSALKTQQLWNALQHTPFRTAKDAYQRLISYDGKRKGAMRSIVSVLQHQSRTVVGRWRQCVDKLKLEELVEALKAQKLRYALSRIPFSTLKSANDDIVRNRFKGALRDMMRILKTRPKLALKTWRQTVEQGKIHTSLEQMETRSTEAEGQLQELTQRLETQELTSSTLEKEVRALKNRLSELLSQPRALHDASNAEKLYAVTKTEVKCFDPNTGQCKTLFPLRQEIQVNCHSASALISASRIFICGGGYPDGCIPHLGKSAYIVEDDGTVLEQSDMSIGRYKFGIIWDNFAQAIYVFGGSSNSGMNKSAPLQCCEGFKSSQWFPLPDMHQPRSWFNPCWHTDLVYLCGGLNPTIETFDPRSNLISSLDVTLPESNECTVVLESKGLIIISWNYISRLIQGRIVSQQRPGARPWSNCASVAVGGVVYSLILIENLCRGVSMKTGVVTKDFTLV